MKLFAIADLHLAGAVDKPMAIFGARWENHVERLKDNWESQVGEGDTVLVAGDISWANSLEEALPDLFWLDNLPGRKILLRGNHDYWWSTLRKIQEFCEEQGLKSLHFLRNDARREAGFLIAGTRGWLLPTDGDYSQQDEKVFRREGIRLGLSLKALHRLRQEGGGQEAAIALFHYPPIDEEGQPSALSQQLEEAGIQVCLFGHIHHRVPYYESQPLVGGIRYIMVASDQLRFCPLLIGEDGQFQQDFDGGD